MHIGGHNVILLAAEDSPSRVIRPRLIAAGADTNRIFIYESIEEFDGTLRRVTFPSDSESLQRAIEETQARLVIVDPLSSHIDDDTDSNNEHSMRRALTPLGRVAEDTGASIILQRHINKSTGQAALYRGVGSIATIALSRSTILVSAHPNDSTRRVVSLIKGNWGEKPRSLEYRVVSGVTGHPVIQWLSESDVSIKELTASKTDHVIAECQKWLVVTLKAPVPEWSVVASGKGQGFSEKQVRRAASGIRVKKFVKDALVWWSLGEIPCNPSSPGVECTAPLAQTPILT